MDTYERWIVEKEGAGRVEVRLQQSRGALLNTVLGLAVVAGGLWLRGRAQGTAVGNGVVLVGLFWVLLALLAWIGDRRLVVGPDEVRWERRPGGTDRWPREAVAAVRLFQRERKGTRSRSALPWRVELDPADPSISLPMTFRFTKEEPATAFASRLAGLVDAPVRSGEPD